MPRSPWCGRLEPACVRARASGRCRRGTVPAPPAQPRVALGVELLGELLERHAERGAAHAEHESHTWVHAFNLHFSLSSAFPVVLKNYLRGGSEEAQKRDMRRLKVEEEGAKHCSPSHPLARVCMPCAPPDLFEWQEGSQGGQRRRRLQAADGQVRAPSQREGHVACPSLLTVPC